MSRVSSDRRSLLPYQPDYARHPAFAPHLRWDARADEQLDGAIDAVERLLPELEAALALKRMALPDALRAAIGPVRDVVDRIIVANHERGADFEPFAERFFLELVRILIDDLAYFERRNGYVPVIKDAHEMSLRNELAVEGFLEFDLDGGELQQLQQAVRPYLDTLDGRYAKGARGREELTLEGSDATSLSLVTELFERRGLNKTVSDVRHEPARAYGYGIELSPDDAVWWHSRYADAGVRDPARAAYFHNDESRDAYKAIIYLDDVDEDRGPFSILPASYAASRPRFAWAASRATLTTVQSDEVKRLMPDLDARRGVFTSRLTRQFFGMLPARLRAQSHFGFDVLDNSPEAAAIAAQEVKIVAPAGHVIVFDGGRLIHRGGLVRRGRRRAMQVVFEVNKRNGLQLFDLLMRDLKGARDAA